MEISEDGTDTYLLKQCITRSPLIVNIYANFKVNLNKKFCKTTSIDHENLLSLKDWNELSHNKSVQNTESYDFDNDDFDMDELLEITKPKTSDYNEDSDIILIDLLIKDSSISINNLDNNFNLPYNIRSSCHLVNDDDDTLLVSSKTGFLFLIKIFQFENTLKPMVIQDINLRNYYLNKDTSFYMPKISTLGKNVFAKDNIVLLTSQSSNIKFCLIDSNKISNSINFFVDGIILLSCFIKINSDHLMFLTLLYTSSRKLQFRLFEKWNDENLDQFNQYSPILLSLDFQVPVFLTSINDLIVLIYEQSITLLGLSYLMSYDLNDFKTHALFTSEKINTFYIPTDLILQENEILISTDNGSIYSIAVTGLSNIELKLIYKIPSVQNISSIAIYEVEKGFKLIYATDSSSSSIILLDSKFDKLDSEKLINWSPIIDYSIIKSKYEEEELWLLSNQNKKTSLYQLNKGYKLTTSINDSFFKRAERIFHIIINDTYYFIFNFLDHSDLYKLEDSELQLVEIEEFELQSKTLVFSHSSACAVHVTELSITLYDFAHNTSFLSIRLANKIVLAEFLQDYIAIIFHEQDNLELEILQIDASYKLESVFKLNLSSLQPSMLKFMQFNNEIFLSVGFFNNDVIFIDMKRLEISSLVCLSDLEPTFAVPHDLLSLNGALIISSRNGYYGIMNINFDNFKFIKLSDSSVKLVLKSETDFLLLSKSIYQVCLNSSKYPTKCLFDSIHNNNKVIDFAYLAGTDEAVSISGMGLNISSLGSDRDSIIVNKKIKLFKNCKKLFDSKLLKIFIVVTGSNFKIEPNSEPLILISQVTKKKLNVTDSKILDEDEVIITIDDWKFEYLNDKSEYKCHLQLLVSCFNTTTKKSCIKIVELKKISNEEITLTKLFQWNCVHPNGAEDMEQNDNKVTFIKQFSNNTIIYCLDNAVYKIYYNFQLKKFEKPILVTSFKTRINNLSVEDDLVILTIVNDSFVVLKYEEEDFKISFKDNLLTNIYNHMILDHRLILIDKYYNILRIFNLNDFTKSSVNFKTDSLLKLSKCQFSSKWATTTNSRFISCSLNGEISIFTVLDRTMFEKFQKILQNKKPMKLFALNYLNDWFANNDANGKVIESEKFNDIKLDDDDIDQALNAITI